MTIRTKDQWVARSGQRDKSQMLRAYGKITIKSVSETDDARIIEGIASTPTPDRMSDVVEPLGAEFALPMPLLWMHMSSQPVGEVTFAKPNKDGIPFRARIMKAGPDAPVSLRERLDMAWHSVKIGLVKAVSIGFRSLEETFDKVTGGFIFKRWEWLELSLVTIPANAEATITSIKSAVAGAAPRAALGTQAVQRERRSTPGASGTNPSQQRGAASMTIKEQLDALAARRAANVARMEALMSKAGEEGRTLDAGEAEEYDRLDVEVRDMDAHIVRLKRHEQQAVAAAVDVSVVRTPEAAAAARGGQGIQVHRNLPKGTAFTRFAIALARSRGDLMRAIEVSKEWKDTPEVELALKAAVNPGSTTDASWAAPLVQIENMASEFIELLRPATIIGRIPGFRRVPFNVKMPRQLTGSSAGWVGQSQPKPLSRLTFDTVTLGFAKCAGIVVLTEELVRLSNPSAEGIVRQDMIDTISQFQDQQFIDPSVAAVANVSPASVTNGVTAVPSTGSSIAQVTADVAAVMGKFVEANISVSGATWVMNPRTALALSLLRTSQDVFAFPGINVDGGTFFGLPVVSSNNVSIDTVTSGDPTIIALVKASDILLADDGAVTLDVSREASLQMDSAPETGGQAELVSLWQNNLVGLRAERMVNWLKRRPAAVQYISGVTY